MLGSMGGVQGLRVADLFCGSGALGIEALSRGAGSVLFVDADPAALAATQANVEAVGLAGPSARYLRGKLPELALPAMDLILADPPYDLELDEEFLGGLDAETIVVESKLSPPVPEGWASHRQRHYGGTIVSVLRRSTHHEDAS